MPSHRLFLILFAAVVTSCGAPDDRPAAAGDPEPVSDELPTVPIYHACAPGSTRTCHIYFTDGNGTLHCPESTQVCGDDYTWAPCGTTPDAGPSVIR